jgi:hypothetical protein
MAIRVNALTTPLLICVSFLTLVNVACTRSNRFSACAEIDAAANAMKSGDASLAVATLGTHAHSPDSFVRTQVVMVASDLGPTLKGPLRERCMEIVGEAISDPSGYVLHASLQGIGNYESSAERYIDSLLPISAQPDYPNAEFALESLSRIGPGHRKVGDRLVEAIVEEGVDLGRQGFPCRGTALRALRSWGDRACPWLCKLQHIRRCWQKERKNRLPLPAEEHDGPAQWARQQEDVEFQILTDVIEELEQECAADGVATIAEKDGDPEAKIEKDRHNP